MTDVGLTASVREADDSLPQDSPTLPGFLQARCEGNLLRTGGRYGAIVIIVIILCARVMGVAAGLGLSAVGKTILL